MHHLVPEVFARFRAEGSYASHSPLGSGHINDSFLVVTRPDEAADYVLQRINHIVFRNVPVLMANILHVTRHLEAQLKKLEHPPFRVLKVIETVDGDFCHRDTQGNYWRLYNHIHGSHSYDVVTSPWQAFEGGKAFGIFQKLTSTLDPRSLKETIPAFHDIGSRLAAFRKAVADDPVKRASSVPEEIGFVEDRAEEMHRILNMGNAGELPLRVTHNDTKFNNILFNDEDRAICIVDLDTVMPGYSAYDFGDAIRTGANTAAEDEKDLSRVTLDLALYEAYARGYLTEANEFLTPAEKGTLAFSARFMTYLIGLRFLTDHLLGDVYYRIHHPGHNLERARVQFALASDMERKSDTMNEIIGQL